MVGDTYILLTASTTTFVKGLTAGEGLDIVAIDLRSTLWRFITSSCTKVTSTWQSAGVDEV